METQLTLLRCIKDALCNLKSKIPDSVGDCDGNDATPVYDKCVIDKIQELIDLIKEESDETQSLISDLIATIDDGVDVTAVLDEVSPTAQGQLQALIQAALEAVTVDVEVGNFADVQPYLQSALQWAADTLQFKVLAEQDGAWTIDLSQATIDALCECFGDLLENTTLDVNIVGSEVTLTVDGEVELGSSTLAALEEIDVNIIGTVPVELTAQNITDLVSALEGLPVTVSGAVDANITGIDPSVIAELQATIEDALDAVEVAVHITNDQLSVSVDSVDPAVLAELQSMIEAALSNVTVEVTGTVAIDSQSISDLVSAFEAANIPVTVTGSISIDPASIEAIAQAIAGETLTVTVEGGNRLRQVAERSQRCAINSTS